MPKSNAVEEHQMLMKLSHISDMRSKRQVEFLRQKTDGEKFTNPG